MAQVGSSGQHCPAARPALCNRNRLRREASQTPHLAIAKPAPANSSLKTDSEVEVAGWLKAAGLEVLYEPHRLPTGLTGKHKRTLVADFYVPLHRVHIEVTTKRYVRVKRSKVRGANAFTRVILIAGPELEELRAGRIKILDLILQAVADSPHRPWPSLFVSNKLPAA